jgi:hypothetical protein
MRNFLLLLFCLLSVVVVNGQIINERYTWNDLEIKQTTCKSAACQYSTIYITHSFHIEYDEVINSKLYGVLIDTVYAYGNIYSEAVGFIREDITTKKTYFLSKYSQDEILLYDFSLKMGDVFNINSFWGGAFTVTNIDSIVYMGQKRLTISLTDGYRSFDWIEGIGSKQGFLYTNYYNGTLLCLTSNTELLFKNDAGYDDCIITIIDNLNDEPYQNEVKIYPNPASEYIRVEKDKTIGSIKIVDLYGNVLAQYKPDQKSFVISLSGIDKGLYLVNIDSEIRKLLVK